MRPSHEMIEQHRIELSALESQAERVVTIREVFDYGFKAGLAKAGLTEHSDQAYENWLWSRQKVSR